MAEFVNLYEWIKTVEPGDFPPVPFKIRPGTAVLDWKKHIENLQPKGPGDYRSRTGALQAGLRRLYKLWNSGHIK